MHRLRKEANRLLALLFTGTTLLKLLREAEKSCLARQQLDRVDCHMAELRRLAYRQVELVETGQLQGHSAREP